MRRGRRSGSDAALLLLLYVLLRGRFGGGRGGTFLGVPAPRRPPPRSREPFNAPPGNEFDNLGRVPLPPNPLAMPGPEPGVILSPGWPQSTPG